MGRGSKRGRTQRRHFRENRENVWKYNNKKGRPDEATGEDGNPNPDSGTNPGSNPSWQPFATKNPSFEEYYKEQRIVPTEEWDDFMGFLRKPLPAAFRINSSSQFFQDIKLQLENDFVKSLEADVTNECEIEAIRPLPWYPGNLAWHLNFSRMQLRKNQTLERFHEFLKLENEIGNITRQEAVSMVPPLFLNVSPEHNVLDMCAAPGSKTFQLLELMHQTTEVGRLPSGLVIANDVDVQRCNLLIHQTKRMCSANLIVTNHEAQHFPSCHLKSGCVEEFGIHDADAVRKTEPSSEGLEELRNNQLLFDRVLCDVPCSGDGTLRKAPDIWRKWHSGMGNGLHNLQVQIAMRGLALLKVGGRMVYSTCSMNPVENEAVVSEILFRSGKSVELLDVSEELPELVRRPGLRQWKVRDKGHWASSCNDVPVNRKSTILPSMFPCGRASLLNGTVSSHPKVDDDAPTNNTISEGHTALDICHDANNVDKEKISEVGSMEISNYPLERCMRILPHDQNSGAFFIAVFQKLSPLEVVPEEHQNPNRYLFGRRNGIQDINGGPETKSRSQKDASENVSDRCSENVNESLPDKQVDTLTERVGINSDGICYSKERTKDLETDLGLDGQDGEKESKGKLQIQGKWKGIDPVVFFSDIMTVDSIRAFYGISESFPLKGHLVSRNEDSNRVKRIYYISKSVHNVLKLNFKVGQRLKIASLGLKIFERQASKDSLSPCAFRISSEGLPLLLPYLSKQVLHASLKDFQHLLQYRNIKFTEFVDADFGEKASKLISGCCVVVLSEGNQSSNTISLNESPISIVCWRGKTSLSVMVSEMDGRELLERISIRFGIEKSVQAGDGMDVETHAAVQPDDTGFDPEDMADTTAEPIDAEFEAVEADK